MIERLMGTGNTAEASAYLGRLKTEWQELTPEIRTGNPVTDMILLEKKKEARMRGIRFECDFRYPENGKHNTQNFPKIKKLLAKVTKS